MLSLCQAVPAGTWLQCEAAAPLSGNSFVQLPGKLHADGLHDLYKRHQKDNRHDHDIQLVSVVAVADGDVSQSAAAHGSGHGGISQDCLLYTSRCV